jgi:hypothetical protein
MTLYSLISAVNYLSSCQDISNHNPGTASAALKQGNSQALQLGLNYDCLTSIYYKLLLSKSNNSIPLLIVSQKLDTKLL